MSTANTGAREQMRRLLALVPYLQTRDSVGLDQVAGDFGVTAATIRADLDVLWYCGLPGLGMGDLIDIDMEAVDEEAVIKLSNAEYLTRPLRLDSTEASALMVALRMLREASSDEERPIVDQVLAKIAAAAGEGAELASLVQVNVPRPAIETAQVLSTLQRAIRDNRQVRLEYYVPARDQNTSRVVDPLALNRADDNDYLDAWCYQAEDQRLFRVDRISAVEVLDKPSAEHPDVAPRDLSEGIFQASPSDALVVLALAPAARWVAEYYPVESAADQPDGTLRISLRVSDPEWLTRLMLRLGGGARVVSPPELAEEVRRAAGRALQHYL